MILFEEPSEGRATAAGDRRKAESIQRLVKDMDPVLHRINSDLHCSVVTNRIDVYAIINDC